MFKRRRFPKASSRRPCCFICNFPNQGWPGLGPKWVRLIQMGEIRDIFHNSVHFGSVSENLLKCDLKRSQICPICGQSDPYWSETWLLWSGKHLSERKLTLYYTSDNFLSMLYTWHKIHPLDYYTLYWFIHRFTIVNQLVCEYTFTPA